MLVEKSTADKTAYTIGMVVLLVLLAGAAYWYLERVLWTDPAFIVFEVMYQHQPVISEYRYGAFVTQVWPLFGYWLHLPLGVILWLYSISFYIFYTGVFVLLGWRWKQYGLGLLFVFYFTLLASDTFFWPNNEVHQGVGWMMLFLGLYRYHRSNGSFPWYIHLLLVPLLLLALNTHLLVAAPFAFLWTYLWLGEGRRPDRVVIGYSLLIASGIGLRYWMSHDSWYDGYKLKGIKDLSWDGFLAGFQSGHARQVAHMVWPDYFSLLGLLIIGLLYVLWRGYWLRAAATVLACLVYAGLVFVTYPASFDRDLLFYIESEWLSLSLIAAAPFCLDLLPNTKQPFVIAGLLAVVFALRLDRIGDSATYYETRLENLRTMTDQLDDMGYQKVRFGDADQLKPYFGSTWGLPAETLLITSLRAQDQGLTVKPLPDSEPDAAEAGKIFRGNFRDVPIGGIDRRYFRLDSLGAYRRLPTADRANLLEKLVPLPR